MAAWWRPLQPAMRSAGALLPWLVPLAVLAGWEVSARVGWLSSRILPEPPGLVFAGDAQSVIERFTDAVEAFAVDAVDTHRVHVEGD